MKKIMISLALVAAICGNLYAQKDTLHIYGPGGPLSAMQDCAKAFSAKTGIPVKVTGGPESKWLSQAQANADVIYGGAEYMLTQFMQTHPGMVDAATRVELYKRRAAILVRPGNPKHIIGLKDLAKPGIKILDVNGAGQLGLWEDIAGKENLIGGIQRNIGGSFANTALGIEAWKKDQSYDAWITYASWHENLKDVTQVVELPLASRLFRGTPVALTSNTKHAAQAKQFIQFLQSIDGHALFKKWGWE
ncbi:substrate-binding domain-containing protein [Mucilaginibacter sp. SMC90]|uniref:substrate-binding domain-containing protein n=1 Tax=Mucilaginibacter TaxID=423349 RepID=UPI00131E888F|nr:MULTISPECIES: substrate-binding domain-containing protein [unclassified Mucilaginibacter]MBS7565692.1 substrate-binding domain-containing protein [Mucilaginibacter sp. Bleaf8]UOE49845.1 substrate-binding domain-containing protein [Mucilaginibacter sp. SMC90]